MGERNDTKWLGTKLPEAPVTTLEVVQYLDRESIGPTAKVCLSLFGTPSCLWVSGEDGIRPRRTRPWHVFRRILAQSVMNGRATQLRDENIE